jgi:hypothetical protein
MLDGLRIDVSAVRPPATPAPAAKVETPEEPPVSDLSMSMAAMGAAVTGLRRRNALIPPLRIRPMDMVCSFGLELLFEGDNCLKATTV